MLKYMRERSHVTVAVFSINAFRLTTQGIDVPVVFGRIGHRDLLVTREVKRALDIVPSFEVLTMRASRQGSRPLLIHMFARY